MTSPTLPLLHQVALTDEVVERTAKAWYARNTGWPWENASQEGRDAYMADARFLLSVGLAEFIKDRDEERNRMNAAALFMLP